MNLSLPSLGALKARFIGLSTRERFFILAGTAAIAFFLGNHFFFESQQAKISSLKTQLQTSQRNLDRILGDIRAIESGTFSRQADEALSNELESLRERNAALETLLTSVQGKTPQIGGLIRGLIRTQFQTVSLDSIKTLPSERVLSQDSRNIYRHGVEISLRGNYLELLRYLQSLESSIDGLFWSGINLNAGPNDVSIRVSIFILSNEAQPILA
jgi:MSHA biogenesis protein MshJ